jgi:hypothetical protein
MSIPLLPGSDPLLTAVPFQLNHSSESKYVTTESQSACLSWNKAPIWGLRPDLYYCLTVAGLLMWGAPLTRGRVCRLPESQSAEISLLSVYTRALSVQAQYSKLCPISISIRYNGSLVTLNFRQVQVSYISCVGLRLLVQLSL